MCNLNYISRYRTTQSGIYSSNLSFARSKDQNQHRTYLHSFEREGPGDCVSRSGRAEHIGNLAVQSQFHATV